MKFKLEAFVLHEWTSFDWLNDDEGEIIVEIDLDEPTIQKILEAHNLVCVHGFGEACLIDWVFPWETLTINNEQVKVDIRRLNVDKRGAWFSAYLENTSVAVETSLIYLPRLFGKGA